MFAGSIRPYSDKAEPLKAEKGVRFDAERPYVFSLSVQQLKGVRQWGLVASKHMALWGQA